MIKIGVFGGMFDPVHAGHLEAAHYAVAALGLDKVLMVPCQTPNHRNSAFASGEHRLAMLALACAEDPTLEPCSIELDREGVSYSVDTMAQLRSAYPDCSFVFLLGLDAFESLPKWERWEELLDDNLLAVFARPGSELSTESSAKLNIAERTVVSADELFAAGRGKVLMLNGMANSLSSTAVRASLKSGSEEANAPMLEALSRYIASHKLY